MLNDESRKTFALKSGFGSSKTFKSVRKMILSALNRFLAESNIPLKGCGIWLDFRKSYQTKYLNGFFRDAGLTGRLEASDYDAVDLVSLFLGALADEFCGLYKTAEVTKVFTQYVNNVNFVFKKFLDTGWSDDKTPKLERDIISSKTFKLQIFSAYKPSGMASQQWHALDHICDAIRELGDVTYLHAVVFRNSHKRF